MTKYQDLKNEVKRKWKLMSAEMAPVIIGAMGIIKKNLTEILKGKANKFYFSENH